MTTITTTKCASTTGTGNNCRKNAKPGRKYCPQHVAVHLGRGQTKAQVRTS